MFRRLRENGPILLVPLAWTFVTAAHLDLVGVHPLLMAHVVMALILVAFTVASWSEMREGVLLAWKAVLVAGLAVTLVGAYGLSVRPVSTPLLRVTVSAWMLVPAAALAYTGRHVPEGEARWLYLLGAVLSIAGWGVYVWSGAPAAPATLVGLTLVNVGQTAGIANAVYQY